jgi:hypothetical protein
MAPVENDMPFPRTPLPGHISLWIILVFNPPRLYRLLSQGPPDRLDLLPKDASNLLWAQAGIEPGDVQDQNF